MAATIAQVEHHTVLDLPGLRALQIKHDRRTAIALEFADDPDRWVIWSLTWAHHAQHDHAPMLEHLAASSDEREHLRRRCLLIGLPWAIVSQRPADAYSHQVLRAGDWIAEHRHHIVDLARPYAHARVEDLLAFRRADDHARTRRALTHHPPGKRPKRRR